MFGKTSLNPSPVMAGSKDLTSKSEIVNLLVNYCVANAHSVTLMPQKKGIIPNYCHNYSEIKYLKDVSCVGHFSSVNLVTNIPTVAIDLPVGAKLHQFWKKIGKPWGKLEGYNSIQRGLHPPLPVPAKFDQVTHSHKLLCKSPQEQIPVGGIASASDHKCSGTGNHSKVTRVFNRLFLVPTPNNWWRPILDLSTLNTFLSTESFKMETPETIRTSLQAGEWVTSIDFMDAYFHIPIDNQSRKYIRFHVQGQSYQFKALPFSLSTAPMEFTVVAKEVKVIRGLWINQYLDDWLGRARSHHTCHLHTQAVDWTFKQNGPFTQRSSKPYARGGNSPKWTCLPPDSTTNYHSLCHRF